MPCGCGGAARALTIEVSANGSASVQATAGMPRYTVTLNGKIEKFDTYRAAMRHKSVHGGKLRPV